MWRRITESKAPRAVILIRLLVGAVFLSEGIQKVLFPDQLGSGRFAKIGLPSPDVLGPFVGSAEIACGALVLVGMFTRMAAIPLLIIMAVALVTTELPIRAQQGFWSMVHEARTDWSMMLGALFLLVVGAGPWSVDRRLADKTGPDDVV
ncbi:MAG: DoxX family protein [Acidobacteria bacterium]|nr:DoxX family protein [Acidobacteriota bacterium]